MPGPLWLVIGGTESRGILVRRSSELTSPVVGRLAGNAIIEEIDALKGRLHYAKTFGDGPSYGWVSTQLPSGKPLLARLWQVADAYGKDLVVSTDPADAEALLQKKLSAWSLVAELDAKDSWLHFKLVSGSGPDVGWVNSIDPSTGLRVFKRRYAHNATSQQEAKLGDDTPVLRMSDCTVPEGKVAPIQRRPFEVYDGVEFWPLDWFSVRWLRERCILWGISIDDLAARAARSALPHIGIDRTAANSGGRRLASFAELGWEAQLPGDNPLEASCYAAPLMSPEEFRHVALPFSKIEGKLTATLEEHGCAVVTDVLSPDEAKALEDLFKADLEELVDTEALRAAPPEVQAAWQRFQEQGPRAFPLSTAARLTASAGFGLSHCIMQGRFAWAARTHPNVYACFRHLHGSDQELVASMDVTFFTPEGSKPQRTSKFSAHVDQNRYDCRGTLSDCSIYQSALYVWPTDCMSSATVLWPGSHTSTYESIMEDAAFRRTGSQGKHYCELAAMQDKEAASRLSRGWSRRARRMPMPAGSLLLWSSRLVHAGWSGGPRLAQAVCWEPRARRSDAARTAKLRLAALGLPSAHWAQVAMQHDMALGDAGFFKAPAPYKVLETEFASEEEDLVVLPLRGAARPAALSEEADLDLLRKLIKVTYQTSGVWSRSHGMEEGLERCIKDSFRSWL